MSLISKRFITKRFITYAVVSKGLYTSKSKIVIREYLEQEALKKWARETAGVDDNGAVLAELTSVPAI